nr:uncharacterized protein LOC109155151 [Ipomoea trifida]
MWSQSQSMASLAKEDEWREMRVEKIWGGELESQSMVSLEKTEKMEGVLKIHDYVGAYKHVTTYFQNESENNTRKMKIFEEIMQLLGFSTEEIMNASEHILKDAHKLDTFFALPKELRSHYVMK